MPSIHLLASVSIAILLGGFAVMRAMRAAQQHVSPEGEPLETTPLQRVARASLSGTLAFAGPGLGFLLYGGIDRWNVSPAQRLLVSILAIMGVVAATTPILLTRLASKRGRLVLDERDYDVLHRAPEAQSWVLMVACTAWTIGLTERFFDVGAVPVPWLSVAYLTTLVAWGLALPLGIVLGYRRA